MRIVALLAVRNEELYIKRCLEHLNSQKVDTCLIDNQSTDRTLEIAREFFNNGIFRIVLDPYRGFFDLQGQLKLKERLSEEIDADWFIHCDADEIREAPSPYKDLNDGISAADKQGYNAINFDEFVFLPTSDNEAFEATDYVSLMRYYYFFQPKPLRQVKAWKKTIEKINLSNSGGHSVAFKERKIFPDSFIMRHYIVLSRNHAVIKYKRERIYSRVEVENFRWHGRRASFDEVKLCFPNKNQLKCIDIDGWDKSDPWVNHSFLG